MSENVITPSPVKRPAKNAGILITYIVAVVCAALAAYEYRNAALLKEQLDHAMEHAVTLQVQLNALNEQLAAANVKLNELQQHNMPVTLIFRRAPTGNGLITVFKNNAPSPLELSVLLNNPVNHHSREASLSIPGNGTQSIGEMEGWIFEPGQHIRLTNAQFGSVDYVVPEQP